MNTLHTAAKLGTSCAASGMTETAAIAFFQEFFGHNTLNVARAIRAFREQAAR